MIATSESRLKVLEMVDVDPNSMTPHYQQLEDQLLDAVACGGLSPGEPLPSEREFSRALGISRMTVRRALTDLEARGRLMSRVGKGWYVSMTKIEQKLEQLSGFSSDMRARGLEVTSHLLEFKREPADSSLADKLGLSLGDPVYRLDRVRLIEGEPVGLEFPRIPAYLCPEMERFDFSRDSLYRVLKEEYGLTLERALQSIEASRVSRHEGKLLAVDPGTPAIRGNRTVYNPEGVVLEASNAVYRGDRYKYQLEIRRDSKSGGVVL
jgi:GntR family transcriptional regulator